LFFSGNLLELPSQIMLLRFAGTVEPYLLPQAEPGVLGTDNKKE